MIFKTQNKTPVDVLIDKEDWDRVKKYNWKKYPSCRYVQASIDGKTTSISRFILKAGEGVSVDHINGDKLDNRKSNLRICAHALNMKNRKPNKNGLSPYKGVVVLKNGRFRSKINSDGKRYELGVYPTERDAVIAYNAAAKVLHGEFSYMNEMPEPDTRAQPKYKRVDLEQWKMSDQDDMLYYMEYNRAIDDIKSKYGDLYVEVKNEKT